MCNKLSRKHMPMLCLRKNSFLTRNIMHKLILLIFILHNQCSAVSSKRSFFITELLNRGSDVPKSKTEVVIEDRTEFGRMIILVCSKTCGKHRSEIPLWLKEYNHEKGYEGLEAITYYYHTYRQPVNFINETEMSHFPNLIYFISNKRHVFNQQVSNKEKVISWIANLDKLDLNVPKSYDELNNILSSTLNCSNKYLLLADSDLCPQDPWPNVARIVQEYGIQPVRLQLPLDVLSSVLLYRRLPTIPVSACHFTILLYENSYSEFGDNISPQMVAEWIENLLPVEEGNCPALFESYWNPIKDELTELEKIYFSAELDIAKRNTRPAYILIGLTGGLAVIVLAYSIFWGLNGSAFAN